MKILYLSHGEHETGGYHLEKDLCATLGEYKAVRFAQNYRGVFAWCVLFVRAFCEAKGDVVVTVARLAWPVYLRNMFNRSKVILVLHNFDCSDGKPALYHKLLGSFMKLLARKKRKIALVVVADFWRDYFQKEWHIQENIFTFPNTFDMQYFAAFVKEIPAKRKRVHFGQYSFKADLEFCKELIRVLEPIGYDCYFSSHLAVEKSEYPIIYFDTHEAYLKQMSESHCTLILNRINEGWNRVAHESFLVGTQVISNGKGGTSELVHKGNGYIAKNKTEVLEIINTIDRKKIDLNALAAFDISQRGAFSEPIKNWLQGA